MELERRRKLIQAYGTDAAALLADRVISRDEAREILGFVDDSLEERARAAVEVLKRGLENGGHGACSMASRQALGILLVLDSDTPIEAR